MKRIGRVVFLLDVDNTLLDNDTVAADLRRHLNRQIGAARQRLYWRIFESLRRELGYADYLGAVQRYRARYPADQHFAQVSAFLIDYPFARRVYPRARRVLGLLRRLGRTVLFTDGDAVFQPLKTRASGLSRATGGRALVYVHKEKNLRDVERLYPARRYVLVDDKPRILKAVKRAWKDRVITVWPRQGHYAAGVSRGDWADVAVPRIGDLLRLDWAALLH